MYLIMVWFLGTLVLAALSWRAFADRRSSRFARFLAEVALWAVLVLTFPGWFRNVLSFPQILSWLLLAAALVLGISALLALSRAGASPLDRSPNPNTSRVPTVVATGPYRFIRHPLYASLVLLGLAAALKNLSFFSVVLALVVAGMCYYCSYLEELENLERFGEEYDRYMGSTWMFLPKVI